MSTTKIVIIVLLIVILLFIALTVWGCQNNGGQTPASDPKLGTNIFLRDRHPHLDGFKSVLGAYAPTLKTSSLRPALTTFDLGSQVSYSVSVLGDDKHQFRQAKFVVQPAACAHVTYKALDATGADDSLRNQDSATIDEKNPPAEFTLTILDAGGTLTIEKKVPSPSPCRVDLK